MSFAKPISILFEVTLACFGVERAFGRRNVTGCFVSAGGPAQERYGRSTGISLISIPDIVHWRWAAISITSIKLGRSFEDGMLQ